jgi:hypothetical protein
MAERASVHHVPELCQQESPCRKGDALRSLRPWMLTSPVPRAISTVLAWQKTGVWVVGVMEWYDSSICKF